MTEDETSSLSGLSGHSVGEFTEVIVSKDFNGKLYFEFPNECSDALHLIDSAKSTLDSCNITLGTSPSNASKLEDERRKKAITIVNSALKLLEKCDDVSVTLNAVQVKLSEFNEDVKSSVTCAAILDAAQQIEALISESRKPALAENANVIEYIKAKMPKYVYYSNYGNLDSQIYLPQVLGNIGRSDLGVKEAAKARTLKTLFKFVDLNPKEITDLGFEDDGNLTPEQISAISEKKKEREILLASASSSFTKSFNEWWKQAC